MRFTISEEDEEEEDPSSPVLSKTIMPSISIQEPCHSRLELELEDSDICSPVLNQRNAEILKGDKHGSLTLSDLKSSKKDEMILAPPRFADLQPRKNFIIKCEIRDNETQSKKQPETGKEPHTALHKETLIPKKIRLFSHDDFDNNQNLSKKLSISKGHEPFLFPTDKKVVENNELKEFGSPEIKSSRKFCSDSVSPEIRTKKTHISSGRKQKPKFRRDLSRTSVPGDNSTPSADNSCSRLLKPPHVELSFEQSKNAKSSSNNCKSQNVGSRCVSESQDTSHVGMCNSSNVDPKSSSKAFDTTKNEISQGRDIARKNETLFGNCENSDFKQVKDTRVCESSADIKEAPDSDMSTSPILETRSLTAKKKRKKAHSVEKEFDPMFSRVASNSTINNKCTSHPRINSLTKEISRTPGSLEKSGVQVKPGLDKFPKSTTPSVSHETFANPHSTPFSPLSDKFSPFSEKFGDFSGAASSSTGANHSNIRKRLSFQSSSTEKKRSKGTKPSLRLNLKKTNNLENQFSKFSQFCKVNTSLSTKSPLNLTIRRSKLKRFCTNREGESSLKPDLSSSENCYNFDRSPSPVLDVRRISESRINLPESNLNSPSRSDISLVAESAADKMEPQEDESCIDDQTDDDPQSPCFKAPKIFSEVQSSFNINSNCKRTNTIPVKRFKFSVDHDEALTDLSKSNNKHCFDSNEPLSPVLEVRKTSALKLDGKIDQCNISIDQDNQISHADYFIDVNDANPDDNDIDDQKILNETVVEINSKAHDENSQPTAAIPEDDVVSSLVENLVSRTQCSMTIEASESSGTQQSRISDGNLPCDNLRDEELATHQPITPDCNVFPENDEIFESGKKRKRRYKNGTLSARLNRLLNRTRSEMRMWAHEMQSEASDPVAIDLVVDAVAFEMNKWLLKSRLISDAEEGDSHDICLAILDPNSIGKSLVSPGSVLRVFPKWQTFDLPSPKVTVIYNMTRVKLLKDLQTRDSLSLASESKQTIQVTDPYCSCSRDFVCSSCVHKHLTRQTVLGPLISGANDSKLP